MKEIPTIRLRAAKRQDRRPEGLAETKFVERFRMKER